MVPKGQEHTPYWLKIFFFIIYRPKKMCLFVFDLLCIEYHHIEYYECGSVDQVDFH